MTSSNFVVAVAVAIFTIIRLALTVRDVEYVASKEDPTLDIIDLIAFAIVEVVFVVYVS